jgi:imidazolonepropionase-like amidohydrolase
VRKDGILGTIEGGKLADLLILTRDPLLDIRNVDAIDRVVKSGRIYREAELLPPRTPASKTISP